MILNKKSNKEIQVKHTYRKLRLSGSSGSEESKKRDSRELHGCK